MDATAGFRDGSAIETTFIGLYERCALIITQKALDLLSKQEMQAEVADELAHEWYWDE